MPRPRLLSTIALFLLGAGLSAAKQPNILLMVTDDQGYGDVGSHGNPILRTPNLDNLAATGVEVSQFVVEALCSPTRASLMTGRYHYRTGVTEVTRGTFTMHADEVTLAEILRDAGYSTGIFGKWHLGDNYPMRPSDQGFQESLVHKGGGIGQAAGPPGNSYFDPVLEHNNVAKPYKGYCDDIFADATMAFMESSMEAGRDKPFFAYYATPLPHFPLTVSDERADPYRKMGLHELNARTYGMIENVDANVGRMLAKLEELDIERDTIVVFLSDNGPRTKRTANDRYPDRYNAGLRGTKITNYDNGLRVPFFIRWTGTLPSGKKVTAQGAHIDLLPTLLDAANIDADPNVKIDGTSLLPLLKGDAPDWPERTLFFQWHEGPVPYPYTNFVVRQQRYKLLHAHDDGHKLTRPPTDAQLRTWLDNLELYDIQADPSEIENLAAQHPEVVDELLEKYEDWFSDVTNDRDFHSPQRTHIGTEHQNPVILSRFDWRVLGGDSNHIGAWPIHAEEGRYRITLRHAPANRDGAAHIRFADVHRSLPVREGSTETVFNNIPLPAAPGRLAAYLKLERLPTAIPFIDIHRLD